MSSGVSEPQGNARHVIVIGSGPAGLTAALYTARANLQPLVIEGLEAGGQLMLTTLVENWPGFRDGIMGPDLMAEMRTQAERFGAEIVRGHVTVGRSLQAALHSCHIGRSVSVPDAHHRHRRVGSSTRPAIRTRAHGARRVSTCATCDGYFFRGKPIAVVGGGDSAMEEATFLTRFASTVTLVHRRDTLRASKIMQDKAFANPKIAFEWNAEVEEIRSDANGTVGGITIRNIKTGEQKQIPVEGVFVAIGHTPNTQLFTGQLEMDPAGYIRTHAGTRTSVPGRVRLRRRPGPRLPAGRHRRRIGLHGRY